MARRKRRRGTSAKKKTKAVRNSKARAALSLSRGHKPVALLVSYQQKMIKNVKRLDDVINKRIAAGE